MSSHQDPYVLIDELVHEFLRRDLPHRQGVQTVVLCGSYATGMATPRSDIDLCYIGELEGFHRESLVELGREIQLMIAPWSWYKHVIEQYEQAGNMGTVTVMLATGRCIWGCDDRWHELQRISRDSFERGPVALPVVDVRKLRVRMTDQWDDLVDAPTVGPERSWLSMELIHSCINAHFTLQNWWATKSKYQLGVLRERDVAVYELVEQSISALGQDIGPLHTLCESILAPVGGWMRESWHS